MASNFVDNLGSVLGQQFLSGENKLNTLDIVENGHVQKFGQLGDFAKQVDQTADRSYTEEGYFRQTSALNPTPKQLEVLLQDPDITVLVKKRAFCSLAENYRPDTMDAHEQLFLKATKFLFQNKCKKIAAYEMLSKIDQVTTEIGQVDYHLLPILFGATDLLSDTTPLLSGLSDFKNIVDQVREVVALNQNFQITTWHTDIKDSFRSTLGEGTGVLELTNVLSVNTTTALTLGSGNFHLSFSDPYELMLITNNDIEQAISDSTNKLYNNTFTQLGSIADQTLNIQKQQLALERQSRNVNPIDFLVEPNTFLGKRVRAIIDGIGYEIKFSGSSIGDLLGGNGNNIDPSALQNSTELVNQGIGDQGLSPSEVGLFNNIVSALFNQLSLMDNTRRQANYYHQDPTLDINGVRKKLRLHYANKRIIQPMDSVSIFISSKKKYDNKITGGLQSAFNGLGFLQSVGNLFQDIKDQLNVYNGYSIEKSVFVGNDFPNWLWLAMRSKFVSDKEGSCVFTGVCEESSSSYSEGVHTVAVSGQDNAAYFKYGLVNIKPSVDVFNGPLYDPLTPFDLKFDTVTGVATNKPLELLNENKGLFSSTFVKYKNGLLAGIKPTEKSYLEPDQDTYNSNSIRQSFYDPDGLVYRWKEGIATLVLFGDSYDPNTSSRGVATTVDPFAGQDIMNVLSLLITGQPYNYGTFYKAAIQFDSMRRDPITNQVGAASFYRGLRSDLKNRNAIYGDFVPFKSLIVDEASFEKMLGGQLTALSFNSDLQQLIEQRATLSDKLQLYTSTNLSLANDIKNEITQLDAAITQKNKDLNAELNRTDNPPIRMLGNDISYNYDPYDYNQQNTSAFKPNDNSRNDLQKKIAFLTRRLAWKVRANQDNNLLIVDDTYDKDYDIQAFEKALANDISTFKSEYTTALDQIRVVADKLHGLEVFANTQGHIEIRNPRYNRVPSSVFYRMLKMKSDLGIQIFPQFLEDLFANQLDEMFDQISIVETQIRFYCLALGFVDDQTCMTFINTPAGPSNGNFQFISDPNGNIAQSQNIISLQAAPELQAQVQGKLSSQVAINAFSVASQVAFLQATSPVNPNSGTIQLASIGQIQSSNAVKSREDVLNNAFSQHGSQPFDFTQLYGANNPTVQANPPSSVDVLHITSQISSFLTDRQGAIKTAANALRNLQEGLTLDTDKGGNGLLFPNLFNSKSVPQVFAHMIEDESYDDIGVGSGSRYVLKNRDIFSYTLKEVRPTYTTIEATGRMDLFIQNSDLPNDLNVFQSGGNGLITAAAIDYDLWRQYGVVNTQKVDAPFLQDPQSQLAPYAVSLLNQIRKQIFQGSVSIVGNEYQQPGEVVYMENQDLLFYVDSVNHHFTYGERFTTDLQLSYGHNPGEYIPTPLDVIGKVLYRNNKQTTNLEHRKQGNAFNQEHLGTIVVNLGSLSTSLNNQFSQSNKAVIQQIISQAAASLSLQSDAINPVLEIRTYFDSTSQFSSPSPIQFEASEQAQILINGGSADPTANINPTASTKVMSNGLAAFAQSSPSQIVVLPVDTGINGEFRYPSSKAFYIARQIAGTQNNSLINTQPTTDAAASNQVNIDAAIYNNIVDIWIVINNPQDQVQS
jgi:hypothetical protein